MCDKLVLAAMFVDVCGCGCTAIIGLPPGRQIGGMVAMLPGLFLLNYVHPVLAMIFFFYQIFDLPLLTHLNPKGSWALVWEPLIYRGEWDYCSIQ